MSAQTCLLFSRQPYIQGVPIGQKFIELKRENSEEDKDDDEDEDKVWYTFRSFI
jgi:hypothetical protein